MTTKSPRGGGALDGLELGRCARAAARPPSSIASSPTSGSRRPTSRPLYSPSLAVGRTPISIEKRSGSPSPGSSPRSRLGLADRDDRRRRRWRRVYQPPIDSRTASSSTASRPTRWMITGGGTLPLRKPGMRRSRPSARAACATRFSTSSAGTSASTRTRDSGSSVTVVVTAAAMGGVLTIPWAPHVATTAARRLAVERAEEVHDHEVAVAAARSTVSSLAMRSRSCSTSLSIVSSSTSGSRRPTSSPSYSPSCAVGRTPISIEKRSGSPSPGSSSRSRFGLADRDDAWRRRWRRCTSRRSTRGPPRRAPPRARRAG